MSGSEWRSFVQNQGWTKSEESTDLNQAGEVWEHELAHGGGSHFGVHVGEAREEVEHEELHLWHSKGEGWSRELGVICAFKPHSSNECTPAASVIHALG